MSSKWVRFLVVLVYFVIVASYGYWIYRRKKKLVTNTHDFFLAEGSLTWWAIGASLIASNISAEQFIGMSGQGYDIGIAVAAYEWIAAIALIIVAVWFMPVYLKNKIFTMPQRMPPRSIWNYARQKQRKRALLTLSKPVMPARICPP